MNKKLLHSKIFGEGDPLLVFHGLFGNGENWISFAERISRKNYQVHLLDIRNHGMSFSSEMMNYDLISQDILNYILSYKISHPILLGHSMGGKAVMNFSIKYPYIAKKIIVVDIGMREYKNQKNYISILKKVNFNTIKTRKDLDFFLKNWILDKKIRFFFSKCTKKNKNGLFNFLFYLPGIEKNYQFITGKINKGNKGIYKGPILFLRGENSNYIVDNDLLEIRKTFPRSKILTVKKAKHWVHIDNPKDFYKKINLFLEKKTF